MAFLPPAETLVLTATGLTRVHRDGRSMVRSLDGVSMAVAAGEIVAVMGPSGSGKTTLLHLLGGLDRPDAGAVSLLGTDWSTLGEDERATFRRQHCGFVVQGFALLPQATAAENVEIPMLLDGRSPEERRVRVAEALNRVGLMSHAPKLPDQLSGGQQQRVAVARALVNHPSVVLADEPTGSLDSTTARDVVALLVEAAQERGAAVVLVTHDPAVAGSASRSLRLRFGRFAGAAAEGGG